MPAKRALVSGSDGRIGVAVVQELREHGYAATPADIAPRQPWATQTVDFTDFAQVVAAMRGHEAVIHLAAIPSPLDAAAAEVFRVNVVSTFNVLEAALTLGIRQVVMASSITALGYGFRFRPFSPRFLPIDETHPLLPQDCYGLSKKIGEDLAAGFLRRWPEMSLASLRFTAVLDADARSWIPAARRQPTNDSETYGAFWTFVDVRDAAAACRLCLERDRPGHEAYFIGAPVIYRSENIRDLMARHFPGEYPVASHIRGNASPVDCGKAERLLGWRARYNWDGAPLA